MHNYGVPIFFGSLWYMDYYAKYIKYKSKYLAMRKQRGGGDPPAPATRRTEEASSTEPVAPPAEERLAPESIYEQIQTLESADEYAEDTMRELVKSFVTLVDSSLVDEIGSMESGYTYELARVLKEHGNAAAAEYIEGQFVDMIRGEIIGKSKKDAFDVVKAVLSERGSFSSPKVFMASRTYMETFDPALVEALLELGVSRIPYTLARKFSKNDSEYILEHIRRTLDREAEADKALEQTKKSSQMRAFINAERKRRSEDSGYKELIQTIARHIKSERTVSGYYLEPHVLPNLKSRVRRIHHQMWSDMGFDDPSPDAYGIGTRGEFADWYSEMEGFVV